jgi:hypothetical protein
MYESASTLNGTPTATHIVRGPSTKLNQPVGIAVDAVGKLIVSNLGSKSITVYPNAAGADADVPEQVEITGASTTLSSPAQIAVNGSDVLVELFVANTDGGNVPIFSDLGANTGNIAPSRNITGPATSLSATGAATGIALDPNR